MYLRDMAFVEHEFKKNHPLLNGKAYGGKRWMPDHPDLPKGYRPLDFKPKPRGRSPIETQFKRKTETAEQDRLAYTLREAGHSYQEIADLLGMKSRQAAHTAAKRGYRDSVVSGEQHDHAANARLTNKPSRACTSPPLDMSGAGKPATRPGFRACGCWVSKGERIITVKGRQMCVQCAMSRRTSVP